MSPCDGATVVGRQSALAIIGIQIGRGRRTYGYFCGHADGIHLSSG